MILDETYYAMDHLIDFRTDVSYMKNYDDMIIPGDDNENVNTYIDVNGQRQDTYSSTKEAVLVRKYFFMEYNRLMKNGRLDQLFDPSPDQTNR